MWSADRGVAQSTEELGVWSVEWGVWSEECGAWSVEEQKLKSMQETNQGQDNVGECVWTSAAKTAHLYIEFKFQGWGYSHVAHSSVSSFYDLR